MSTSPELHENWVAGRRRSGGRTLDVRSPFDGEVVGVATFAEPAEVETALASAHAGRASLTHAHAHERSAALRHVAAELDRRSDEFARVITRESGKPVKWSRGEVARAIATFEWASDEARRWSGEFMRLDAAPGSEGRVALVRRFPRGTIVGVTPFNFPLNLVAHKVAPAIAVGAPIIVKPSPRTPLSALALNGLVAETNLPTAQLSTIVLDNARVQDLVGDPTVAHVSFTGSAHVGWQLRAMLPRKHVTLELGGNATAIVCGDYQDLDWAASRCATFGAYQAGQSCISVQRVLVAAELFERFVARLEGAMSELATGDPFDENTDVGPLIDEDAARRVVDWIEQAVDGGAELVSGGTRDGNSIAPTLVVDVPRDAWLVTEEVFGPVVSVAPFEDVEDAFTEVNSSRYGLQTGVFTHDLAIAFRAHRALEVGGVVIGDVPSYRVEQMPYGGIKDSGVGREGVRYAMGEFTEPRALVLTGVAL